MRISDWSSDVCSSELDPLLLAHHVVGGEERLPPDDDDRLRVDLQLLQELADAAPARELPLPPRPADQDLHVFHQRSESNRSSEERRGGTECVSPCGLRRLALT